jgi:2-hydroxychromene-2-carboxylate isomerase
MLTSVGTPRTEQGAEAARQKTVWLKRHGIDYHPNFVKMFSEKKKYATPMSILIDDRPDCALPFTEAGGHGILHDDKHMDKTLATLDSLVLQLKAINAKS